MGASPQHRAGVGSPQTQETARVQLGSPSVLLFPPCPRSSAPNSSGATRGAFHICHPDLGCRFGSSSPAMGSAELLWPVGVWSHQPLSPPELASVEGPREPPDQPRNHTRGCVRRQGGLQGWVLGWGPEAACGSLLLMPAGQRPQFRFSREWGPPPGEAMWLPKKHA